MLRHWSERQWRPVLREPKAVRFRFVEDHRDTFPAARLCQVVDVSMRGLRAFRSRPASRRQRSDLVTLAHIKEQSRLSLGRYGRPRMTEELKEIGLNVGHRRPSRQIYCVNRLPGNGGPFAAPERHIRCQTPQTQGDYHCPAGDCEAICREGDSNHKFNIAPNLLDRNFTADQPNQKWAGDISYVWTREGWLYLAVLGSAFTPRHRLGCE